MLRERKIPGKSALEAVIVSLESVADLEACGVDHTAMAQFHAKWRKCNLLVYAHDENDLRIRVFMDEPGFPEDPATGIAKVSLNDGIYDIRVGGNVKPVAKGEWL